MGPFQEQPSAKVNCISKTEAQTEFGDKEKNVNLAEDMVHIKQGLSNVSQTTNLMFYSVFVDCKKKLAQKMEQLFLSPLKEHVTERKTEQIAF